MIVISASIYDEALISKFRNWTDVSKLQIYSPNDARQLFQVTADNTNDKPIQLPILCLSRNAGYDVLNPNKRVMTYDGITVESVQGPFLELIRESESISDVEVDLIKLKRYIDLRLEGRHVFIFDGGTWKLGGSSIDKDEYGISYQGEPATNDKITIVVDDSSQGRSFQLNAVPISIPYQLDLYTRYFEEADTYIRNIIFNIINYPTMKVIIPYNGQNIEHVANVRLVSGVIDNSSVPERLVVGQFTRLSLDLTIDDAYLFDTRLRNNVSISLNFDN